MMSYKIMGTAGPPKPSNFQSCCAVGICSPQPELVVSEYIFEPQVARRQGTGKFDVSQSKELSQIRESLLTEQRENSIDKPQPNKLQELVDSAKTLQLKVISSSTLPRNAIIKINALGFENSERKAQDGFTYFGCHDPVDFKIPSPDQNSKGRGPHFAIFYDVNYENYFINDLGIGFGTFLKVDRPLILKHNYLLLIGNNFLLVNLMENGTALKLKLYGPPCAGDVFFFSPRGDDFSITIGRKATCDIQINDSLASKVQATICFTSSQDWVLYDGDFQNKSTNGTWLYLSESHEMHTGMMFKAIHTLFEVTIL